VQRTTDALSEWLTSGYGPTLTLQADTDDIPALASERDALWTRVDAATFLTNDEKRAAVGYGPNGEAATPTQKFNPNHDELGRFATGDGSDPNIVPIADKPQQPKAPPPPSAKPATPPPKPIDPPPKDPGAYGKTPSGREYTGHTQASDELRGFTGDRIDAIVDNNAASRAGKVDDQGRKTWEYTDSRGNKVVTNERGGIVSAHSPAPGGRYIPKP
jgi:hypothetical protein